ncbi:Glycerol-3-phosphate dehydrogenase SDP6, mitochondrial [Auxenochlorella protothecoides]|uniref:Glycerol-3-phosphate dehydrogenase n=1 Tax=Auxenochlorella protothecoides TaxID=3075 RepID=A0A087SJE3_AUXPR|nr:Glycerol-3-phosphate dehydrogenase SDP6, mitochondrial [Auxenochlorella protothecoides]KFM25847.1 Glycerol-3-phosphate dehydrogenase SDP6, mitochondrial [Auxenochlorella protothecoides]RMZ55814.1 hypothetical protein APUTEX25_003780 [Auxenochlorella protothecoides]|eukprot:RMZ55814.1 hypothetical protein APUTEX25_003780 [Auxenochlorella protothecoides]
MRRLVLRSSLLAVGAGAGYALTGSSLADAKGVAPKLADRVPSREERLASLAKGTAENPFDVLIIGGGATGTGCALDAVTRGLTTALVEREDFAAGTSSRSTKLVHGGVRYLEKAVKQFDYGQYKLVHEALHERKTFLSNAPHLSHELPIMTPCYSWWEVPYYWAGMKLYDAVAGGKALSWSYYLGPTKSRAQFPTMAGDRPDGKTLKGTIVYYDGQFNDARLAVSLAVTAALAGATVVNHAEATSLIKAPDGRVTGAVVTDGLTGRATRVHARTVINATGPFADGLRRLSDPGTTPMIMPSAGVHVTLPDYYSPENVGLIVPKTKDGRVVFMLPWLGHTIAGTTDADCAVTMRPQAREEEVQFILDAIADYLTVKVRRSDVMSAWAGIRPLALDPNAADTASASRDHIVTVDPDGIITVTGGKWTTYRLMAQDAIDRVLRERGAAAGPCVTAALPLVGGAGFYPGLFTEVAQTYKVPHRPGAIDTKIAKYLVESYGDRAHEVTRIAEERRLGRRLVQGHPTLEAEVVYAVHNEFCETPEDFVARRTRFAFLDKRACEQALPRVVELMAKEKGWGRWKAAAELKRALEFIKTFDSPDHPAFVPTA